MKIRSIYLAGVILFMAAVSGGLFVSEAKAAPAVCSTQVTLVADGAGSFQFEFNGHDNLGDTFSFTLADGQSDTGFTPVGATAVITEEPQDGYVFAGIVCDAGTGVVINEIPGGFTIDCLSTVQGTASCVVTNIRIVRPVPTLSEWGMIAAAAGLGLIGVFFALRRRMAKA